MNFQKTVQREKETERMNEKLSDMETRLRSINIWLLEL